MREHWQDRQRKEAAEEAAKEKSFGAIYEASQAAVSNEGLQTSSAGDAKKGASLFKVALHSTNTAVSSNHFADTVRSMPYCRRSRRQQDRSKPSRPVRSQDWPSGGLLIHRCQQAEGHHMGREHTGMNRGGIICGHTLIATSLNISRTPRNTSLAPRWLLVA